MQKFVIESNGTQRIWQIEIQGTELVTQFGIVGKKLRSSRTAITGDGQLLLAKKIAAKKKQGYVELSEQPATLSGTNDQQLNKASDNTNNQSDHEQANKSVPAESPVSNLADSAQFKDYLEFTLNTLREEKTYPFSVAAPKVILPLIHMGLEDQAISVASEAADSCSSYNVQAMAIDFGRLALHAILFGQRSLGSQLLQWAQDHYQKAMADAWDPEKPDAVGISAVYAACKRLLGKREESQAEFLRIAKVAHYESIWERDELAKDYLPALLAVGDFEAAKSCLENFRAKGNLSHLAEFFRAYLHGFGEAQFHSAFELVKTVDPRFVYDVIHSDVLRCVEDDFALKYGNCPEQLYQFFSAFVDPSYATRLLFRKQFTEAGCQRGLELIDEVLQNGGVYKVTSFLKPLVLSSERLGLNIESKLTALRQYVETKSNVLGTTSTEALGALYCQLQLSFEELKVRLQDNHLENKIQCFVQTQTMLADIRANTNWLENAEHALAESQSTDNLFSCLALIAETHYKSGLTKEAQAVLKQALDLAVSSRDHDKKVELAIIAERFGDAKTGLRCMKKIPKASRAYLSGRYTQELANKKDIVRLHDYIAHLPLGLNKRHRQCIYGLEVLSSAITS